MIDEVLVLWTKMVACDVCQSQEIETNVHQMQVQTFSLSLSREYYLTNIPAVALSPLLPTSHFLSLSLSRSLDLSFSLSLSLSLSLSFSLSLSERDEAAEGLYREE